MVRVILGPVLRCLLMGTHMLVRRSPGTCSMTRPLFLFPCGGFSLPSFRLLSGPVFLFPVACGVELYGCRAALLFLIPSLRCLFVGTRMLFHRSLGIDSMTCFPLLFFCGGVPLPALRLLGGLSVLIVSAVAWGEVGRCGHVSFHPACHNYRG